MPIYTPGKLILSKIQQYPAVIGEAFGGGYFAGYISHTADGSPTHALIVAPRATGATGSGYTLLTTEYQWKTTGTTTANTTSQFDGASNTAAMVTAGIANHPAANFCVGLNIGGFTDWYLPARLELDIAYFNLKPTTTLNDAGWGVNAYSVPPRQANTLLVPPQTTVLAFRTGGAEQFYDDYHWSSTESNATLGWSFRFSTGLQNGFGQGKTGGIPVRAFRRIAF